MQKADRLPPELLGLFLLHLFNHAARLVTKVVASLEWESRNRQPVSSFIQPIPISLVRAIRTGGGNSIAQWTEEATGIDIFFFSFSFSLKLWTLFSLFFPFLKELLLHLKIFKSPNIYISCVSTGIFSKRNIFYQLIAHCFSLHPSFWALLWKNIVNEDIDNIITALKWFSWRRWILFIINSRVWAFLCEFFLHLLFFSSHRIYDKCKRIGCFSLSGELRKRKIIILKIFLTKIYLNVFTLTTHSSKLS